MSRLTEKVKNTDDYIKLATKDKQEFINKLGRLEDLEEEIGLTVEEMAIICKIVKNGFIYEDEDNNTFYLGLELMFDFDNHELVLSCEYDDDYFGRWEEVGRFKITDYKTKFWLKKDKSE